MDDNVSSTALKTRYQAPFFFRLAYFMLNTILFLLFL